MAHDARGYYKLLNLESGSGIEEVNLAYGFLKYEWEKDGCAPDRRIQQAYDCLSHPNRKAAYDSQRGDAIGFARRRLTGYVLLLMILLAFAAFVFPGFLKSSPRPFGSADRLIRSSTGSFFGEIIRREQFHKFPLGQVGPGYLVRMPDGEQRWFPAAELERHFRQE